MVSAFQARKLIGDKKKINWRLDIIVGRGMKQRYYPTLGFGAFASAKRFCQVFEEVRQFLRTRERMAEFVSLSKQRQQFVERIDELHKLFQVA